ncbi:hypothetical protein EB241_19775 [Erwinia psidii]|uniref:Uncharacterized protein n=1 Tax=Erwinia psidii TaxID=69224 RepID=A0A3N6RW48_9GAMM|nr:hypothetical protein EB241_19775 [Erwinia psidii]
MPVNLLFGPAARRAVNRYISVAVLTPDMIRQIAAEKPHYPVGGILCAGPLFGVWLLFSAAGKTRQRLMLTGAFRSARVRIRPSYFRYELRLATRNVQP